MYKNKMVDHRICPKLPPTTPVVLVTNGYAATIKTLISTVNVRHRVVDQSKLPVSQFAY